MIPVNTCHHLQVGADPFGRYEIELPRLCDRGETSTRKQRSGVRPTDQLGSQVENDLVHDVLGDRSPCDGGATLQKNCLDVALTQIPHERRERHPIVRATVADQHFCSGTLPLA